MSAFLFKLIPLQVLLLNWVSSSDPRLKGLTDHCLRCICAASSECDPAVRCHTHGPVEYYCGPYQFSERYWESAGSPGQNPSDPMDFETCANDIACAIRTVRSYMSKNAKDCDQDGWITCSDFALLHKAGPRLCGHTSWATGTKFWKEFASCAEASALPL